MASAIGTQRMAARLLRHGVASGRTPLEQLVPLSGWTSGNTLGCIRRVDSIMRSCFCSSPASAADLIVSVPPMAESISEGTLAIFHKRVGDFVDEDGELASIETDKIDVAVQIPEGGVIMELLVEEGEVVTVGQAIARVETGTNMQKQSPQQKQEEEEEEASKPDANKAPASTQQELSEEKPSALAKDQPAGELPRQASASQSISSSTTMDPRQALSASNETLTIEHVSAPRGERLVRGHRRTLSWSLMTF